ncbi:ABC transporter ATP-binding protein [Candidatus Mycoplasma mahonii]|uniref:ABC transporter ATP-binding protein n=1 Tax=Candidatus Mycoplasma mahonii TaxID=3004105 RepID=UPI0026F0AE5D|nr:ABC transporter ATP-binding protein [Candidatus Mycoplasma mahonii]WKX02338.1 ABC transporter ATP-binding protein [Candidatus Mycoplasma mahonii]
MKHIIKVKDLRVSFRSANNRKKIIQIIRGISFNIEPGKIFGFIGESGSGKSVTAKAMFGMNENAISVADEFIIDGTDMLLNKPVSKLSKKNEFKNQLNIPGSRDIITNQSEWRKIRGKKITYIPQNPMTSLNPTMKIRNQLLESLGKASKLSKTEKIHKIINLLESFGMRNAKARINSFPHEFSGGMRQRVVIAMAVLSNPSVIIADEPTTALDPSIQASVLKLFKDIVKKTNIALIFVSHDISVISLLVDVVNVFYAGRIVETGDKYDVFTNPKHPYTWALLSSMPESNKKGDTLYTLKGSPPNFAALPNGDPFSVRNPQPLKVDFKEEPSLFEVGDASGHMAATWLLHPDAPIIKPPKQVLLIASEIKKDMKHAK